MKMQFWNCLQLTSKSRITFYIVSIVSMNMTGIIHVVNVRISITIDTMHDDFDGHFDITQTVNVIVLNKRKYFTCNKTVSQNCNWYGFICIIFSYDQLYSVVALLKPMIKLATFERIYQVLQLGF